MAVDVGITMEGWSDGVDRTVNVWRRMWEEEGDSGR